MRLFFNQSGSTSAPCIFTRFTRGGRVRMRGGLLRGFAVALGLLLVLIVLAAAGGWYGLDRWGDRKAGGAGRAELEIPRGASLESIASRLADKGIVGDPRLFMAYAWREGKHRSLQAGDYRFALPVSPAEVLRTLQSGSFERRLTIPEGWTKRQIAEELLEEGWIADTQTWFGLVAQPVPESRFGFALPAGSEGFCFPDTYFLEEGSTAEIIHDRMLRQFARIWSDLDPQGRDPRSADLTPLEVVTLASMIQREARSIEEMPAIASVYLNRLRIRMRLQCCATIHYALGEVWDRPLRYADLEIDSPYNTYKHYGLPPGPIGNPGREAIAAVLRPEDNDYLYYVYKGDGTHAFSKTYREHQAAARRYRQADPNADLIGAKRGSAE